MRRVGGWFRRLRPFPSLPFPLCLSLSLSLSFSVFMYVCMYVCTYVFCSSDPMTPSGMSPPFLFRHPQRSEFSSLSLFEHTHPFGGARRKGACFGSMSPPPPPPPAPYTPQNSCTPHSTLVSGGPRGCTECRFTCSSCYHCIPCPAIWVYTMCTEWHRCTPIRQNTPACRVKHHQRINPCNSALTPYMLRQDTTPVGHSVPHTTCLHINCRPLGVADRLHYCTRDHHMLSQHASWASIPLSFWMHPCCT